MCTAVTVPRGCSSQLRFVQVFDSEYFFFSLFMPLEFTAPEMLTFKMKFLIRMVHTGVIGVNGDVEHSRSHTSCSLGAGRARASGAREWAVCNYTTSQKDTSHGGDLNLSHTSVWELPPRGQHFKHHLLSACPKIHDSSSQGENSHLFRCPLYAQVAPQCNKYSRRAASLRGHPASGRQARFSEASGWSFPLALG